MAHDAGCAFVGARRLRTVRDGPEIVHRSDRTHDALDDLGSGIMAWAVQSGHEHGGLDEAE